MITCPRDEWPETIAMGCILIFMVFMFTLAYLDSDRPTCESLGGQMVYTHTLLLPRV